MLCEYRYELKFPLRLPQAMPVWVSDFHFEFETSGDLLVAVRVAVACNDADLWPHIKVQLGTNAQGIVFPSPRDTEVNEIALTFLALLSLRGWKAEWNGAHPTRNWTAQTLAESNALVANDFKMSRVRRHSAADRPVPINDLLQTALASDQARAIRQPLEFVQYATERYEARRFIEAFQYYYLAIESIYCTGLSRTPKVVDRFMSVPRLRVRIRMAVKYPTLYLRRPEEKARYRAFVANLASAKDAFTKLVEQRGHLHHHNIRSPEVWSLHGQERFWEIATLAANFVMPQLFWESKKYVWSEDVLHQFALLKAN